MKERTRSIQSCTISFSTKFLPLIMLAILLSSCDSVIQTPLLKEPDQAQSTQPLTSIPPTETATQILTPETNTALETIPVDLNFMDDENVKNGFKCFDGSQYWLGGGA